jgi:hypothetical protein
MEKIRELLEEKITAGSGPSSNPSSRRAAD